MRQTAEPLIDFDWGRTDIHAELMGQVMHLTQYGHDGPGVRRRPIDQLRDDGVISYDAHVAGERLIALLAAGAAQWPGASYSEDHGQPGSKCPTTDEKMAAQDAVEEAAKAVVGEVGRLGWTLLAKTLGGASLASVALSKGYVRGMGRGDAMRMHSQVRDAYDALAQHFAGRDRSARTRA